MRIYGCQSQRIVARENRQGRMFEVRDFRPLRFGPYDFVLEPGECLVVSGPSGSGKSLLLRAIADLDPSTGKVLLNDRDRNAMSAAAWRRDVRYVAAEPGWWQETAAAHFDDPETAKERLTDIGLEDDVMTRDIALLSTGERQRLAILRAIESQPTVLLLDEPTAALDQQSTGRVEALLKAELKRGAMIVLVTHSQTQAKRFAAKTLKLSGNTVEAAMS